MSSRRTRRALSVLLISTGLVAGALVTDTEPAAGAEPPENVLSHFLCYKGRFPDFEVVQVVLDSQFGSRGANVRKPHLFCNPVKKKVDTTTTPIVDENHHLKAYKIEPLPTASREVQDTNQFGVQPLTIEGGATKLLVPTRKKPHPAPTELSHFECYKVLEGQSINKKVTLRDQFGRFETRVREPQRHCNPSAKTHNAVTHPIVHPTAHLLCYRIDPRPLNPPVVRKTANQFEQKKVRSEVAVLLCVPSTKELPP